MIVPPLNQMTAGPHNECGGGRGVHIKQPHIAQPPARRGEAGQAIKRARTRTLAPTRRHRACARALASRNARTHTHMHTSVHTRKHTHTYAHKCAYMHTHTHTHTHTHARTHTNPPGRCNQILNTHTFPYRYK